MLGLLLTKLLMKNAMKIRMKLKNTTTSHSLRMMLVEVVEALLQRLLFIVQRGLLFQADTGALLM